MGDDAITGGPAARDATNRKRRTAALLAAFWPSLLGPEHGADWRTQNRRIWRRRLSHVALIAGALGVSTLAAAPPFHRIGTRDATQVVEGRPPHRGVAGGAGEGSSGDGQGAHRVLITFRDLHDRHPAGDLLPAAPPETVAGHLVDAIQGPDPQGLRQPWGSTPDGGPPGHEPGAYAPGGGGGGPSPEPSPSDRGAPGQPTDFGPPGGSQAPDGPSYVVDPDAGPHGRGDSHPPPSDWRPKPNFGTALSPVPEPQTWLMMVGGFAWLGFALRRRRSLRTAAHG